MAINREKLKDLFGTDDTTVSINSQEAMSFFGDNIAQSEDSGVFDVMSEEDSYTGNLDLLVPEEDDLLPQAPILRNNQASPVTQATMDADVDFALRTQNHIINKGQQLIQMALNNAIEDGSAKSIEAAAKTIDSVGKSVERLLGIYEKLNAIKTTSAETSPMGNGNTFVQNQVVYQGTTSDIIKQLMDEKKE